MKRFEGDVSLVTGNMQFYNLSCEQAAEEEFVDEELVDETSASSHLSCVIDKQSYKLSARVSGDDMTVSTIHSQATDIMPYLKRNGSMRMGKDKESFARESDRRYTQRILSIQVLIKELHFMEEDIKSSRFFIQVTEALHCVLREWGLEHILQAGSSNLDIKGEEIQIVCLGLGQFSFCTINRYRLAFLFMLKELLQCSHVYIYDTHLSIEDIYLLKNLELPVLTINEKAMKGLNRKTIYVMLKCDLFPYNHVLLENYNIENVSNISVIGNGFKTCEIMNSPFHLQENAKYVYLANKFAKDIEIKDDFGSVFSGTSVLWFKCGSLPLLVPSLRTGLGESPYSNERFRCRSFSAGTGPPTGNRTHAGYFKNFITDLKNIQQELKCSELFTKLKENLRDVFREWELLHFLDADYSNENADYSCKIKEQKTDIVCYGLGHFSYSKDSFCQLGLLLILKKLMHGSQVYVYDPVFSVEEIYLLKRLDLNFIATNEKGMRVVRRKTVCFMPYCDWFLYNNILIANWSVKNLSDIAIIGNSFKEHEREKGWIPSIDEESKYVYLASRFVNETIIKNNIYSERGFGRISLHWFKHGDLSLLAHSLWAELED